MIDKKGQLLLMAGIMMCVTVMVVSISISHSVTLGQKQGENHDLTPMISMVIDHFPNHLDWAIDESNISSNNTQESNITQITSSFVNSANEFELFFIENGYALSLSLNDIIPSEDDTSSYSIIYSLYLTDGEQEVTLSQTDLISIS